MDIVDLIPLHLLRAGQSAEVAQLLGAPDEVHRLEELGLRRGVVVQMLQPGTPCIICLAGHRLCFRNGDLFGVMVREEHAA